MNGIQAWCGFCFCGFETGKARLFGSALAEKGKFRIPLVGLQKLGWKTGNLVKPVNDHMSGMKFERR